MRFVSALRIFELTKCLWRDLWALGDLFYFSIVFGEICERLGIFYFSIVFIEIYERLMIIFINFYIVSGEICERLLNF